MKILINGEPGESISVLDRGFQYGDGVFETLAVANGQPLLWDRHMRRFFHGAMRLGIQAPAEGLLRREAEQVCRGASRGVLKIMLTRGVSGRGYAPGPEAAPTRTVGLLPWPDYPATYRTDGVNVQFCHTLITRHNILAGLKHLNRLEQILARMELKDGCAEGLMQDETGHVIEGTMTNLFVVSRGTLLTPDLKSSGVTGVMRGLVLERAPALSIDCRVTGIKRENILDADEVFLTNSLIGVWPVRRIDSREYPAGTVTRQIQEVMRDATVAD
ncbi:4-amino-4-deoxychorismate lyase [Sulfuricaulis limicola]|uniref:Aminodeoxychorismate lyase n=1 Tax=Sulfuricaulis limicola TaxID=1620215 RepID=A0A1B4XFX0_9GAMM|nr:aminodeoxychorismate lyase [Sulfuricaulis limicola]BAV33685.1 4-amino-4-deoxychorismate lyase [Sulfuricaulis limicola]